VTRNAQRGSSNEDGSGERTAKYNRLIEIASSGGLPNGLAG